MFRVLPHHLPGGTEEKYEKITEQKIESGISRLQPIGSANHYTEQFSEKLVLKTS
jgi:hypothetical protein